MIDTPFLIAHKVRGEAAFDIAVQMHCPHCNGTDTEVPFGCHECDELGYWWIIPTSGHRAWPYWHHELADLCNDIGQSFTHAVPEMPAALRDHYPERTTAEPSLVEMLGLAGTARRPLPPIRRRM